MEGSFLYQALIYLAAAVIAVPIAKKLGLGSVLGYLLAGVIIGPFVLNLIGEEGQNVMHFAEFGVVMMLFLIGLELKPTLLWKLRVPILGLGGLQVGITAGVITLAALLFSDLPWQTSLAIGLTLALSSTAIVLQTLTEKGLMKSVGGQNAFSVLLFQDIAVIPILAIFPLLAVSDIHVIDTHQSEIWIDGLPIALKTTVILGVISSIILAGKYLIGPIFRLVALTGLRELFTAAALLLIIAITYLMTQVGLSPALGTFLAGVVLAQSEYRHELETNIEPFKGLLLGLFFIAVGASIDFLYIASKPMLITYLVLGLIAVKLIILMAIGKIFGMRMDNNLLFTFSLAQGGEFAFVLFSFAQQNSVMTPEVIAPLTAAVAISMALTPLLMILNEKLIQPNFGTQEKVEREEDVIDEKNEIIIAGFGRYGSTIGRFLQANKKQATYLDIDPNTVDLLRKMGLKVFYGDASRYNLLHAAGASEAKLLIVAVDNEEKSIEIIETVKKHFPQLTIHARAKSWNNFQRMTKLKVDKIYREHLDTSLRMGADALDFMGHRNFQVHRASLKFRKHDDRFVGKLATHEYEKGGLVRNSRQYIHDLEKMMIDDLENEAKDKDLGWDTGAVKKEFAPIIKELYGDLKKS